MRILPAVRPTADEPDTRAEAPGLSAQLPRLAVFGALAVGLAVRAWLAWGHDGIPDSDEAVSGLMARQMLHGHLPLFYWGQSYGGSLEEGLIALWFRLVGASVGRLKVVPVALGLAGVYLTWRIGRRTIGPAAAAVAAGLAAIWPLGDAYWSTKARGFYGVAMVSCLLAVLLALRLRERSGQPHRDRRDWLLLGLAVGVAWWSTPLAALVLLPTAIWLLAGRRPRPAEAAGSAAVAVAVLLPWILWNLHHAWSSLSSPSQQTRDNTYVDHLQRFAVRGWPLALGLQVPLRPGWLVGPIAGWTLAGLAVVAMAAAALRTRGAVWLLVAIVLAYPLLLALTPDAYYLEDTRYIYLLQPFVVLLAAAALARFRLQTAGLLAAVVVTLVGLQSFTPDHQVRLQPLAHALEARHLDRAGAPYWVAYDLTFQSGGKVVATPTGGTVRSLGLAHEVRSADRVAFVVPERRGAEHHFERIVAGRPILEYFDAGGYAVFVLRGADARHFIPATLGLH